MPSGSLQKPFFPHSKFMIQCYLCFGKSLTLLSRHDRLGITTPRNTALFIVGNHGLSPQAQLFPAETMQTSMVKGCEKPSCYKAEIAFSLPNRTEYFQIPLTKRAVFSKATYTSHLIFFHPILPYKAKTKQ